MKRTILPLGSFAANCTLIESDDHLWVVDPGGPVDLPRRPDAILLTHAHFDHIAGIPSLQTIWPDVPVYVHPHDEIVITHPFNQNPPDYPPIARPHHLADARSFTGARVIETPGHTPGGVCYYFPDAHLLLAGDTLFAGSAGRTDLPGGNARQLFDSLRRLMDLPDETTVIPGHGPFTTIGAERRSNPFILA